MVKMYLACMSFQLFQSFLTLCDPMDCRPHQTLLSMGFSRQEYYSGLLCPPPGDLPDPGIEHASPSPSASEVDSLLLKHWGA